MKTFVTGIGTEIGKTVVSSILVEALEADYWKPIQAGELEHTDSDKIKELISNSKSTIHPEGFRLKHPMSPHAAAEREGIEIKLDDLIVPEIENRLVIEGAGGLMVPINNYGDLMIDLIERTADRVVVVSENYLGSINHTLLTAEALRSRGLFVLGVVFNGPSNPETEEVILSHTGWNCIGRIKHETTLDKTIIRNYADEFQKAISRVTK
jgi:dethiobiotin synthetase